LVLKSKNLFKAFKRAEKICNYKENGFMQILRAFGLVLLSFMFLALPFTAETADKANPAPKTEAVKLQQLVESIDIQGNRRLRDEDLLYYVKTQVGDVYNQSQLERDLQDLLSLNFFDKVKTRVLTEEGVRGGVNVIFEVVELQIIRDLQFEGLKAVPESDVLKAFREQRVGISREAYFNPVNSQKGIRVIRELLASKGYPNAKVTVDSEEVSATSTAVIFKVEQGNRSRIVDIEFEGNEIFKDGELRGQLQLVKETGLISRFQGQDILDLRKLQYDLRKNVLSYMFSKGYFQARIGEPQVVGLGYKRTGIPVLGTLPLPIISSKDDTLKIIVPVTEGRVFRVGELKVEGNSIFSEEQILAGLGLKKGEIADGKRVIEGVDENLKKAYGTQGFVLAEAEFNPDFKDNPNNPKEGIVDITIVIDEGKQFRLRRLEFTGNTFTRDKVLRREVLINEGDIYNQNFVEISVGRLNQTNYFDPLDKDRDVEIRTDEEQGDVDLIIKVSEKGRQQIQFNGGISGIGGSFFGLEYSTNNLLGRGEVLSFNFGFGNRQQNLQFTYQNPYFRDRPISVGFSLFASRYNFFGEGTFLSQNQSIINDALNPQGALTTSIDNLFTQKTYGASVFATAPLSEFLPKRPFSRFSRVGVSYQFSATSIDEPRVNQLADTALGVPVVFSQPSIITSRITPSFVYDYRPRNNGIDTVEGKQFTATFALSGLGGDVRTYQPRIEYSQFIPVRRKKSTSPEVFAFRVLAGTIGSFATSDRVRNTNSLNFIAGIPRYERFFLGSESDIRGYDSRSIGPIAPFDGFVTSRNVIAASNVNGTPVPIPNLNNDLSQLGTFTGVAGANSGQISRNFQFIGGDTQVLGNFEYRVPLFGPVVIAAFADVGSVFNLQKTGSQVINSNFFADDTLVGAGTLTALALRNNPNIESRFGSLLLFNDNLLTTDEFRRNFCQTGLGCPISPPQNLQQIFLRGEAQTNTVLRIDESAFSKFGDIRSSVGLELRVQVPVVNVPFRLIYYYNPNAKIGITEEVPGLFLPGKRSGFRFTVGRTF